MVKSLVSIAVALMLLLGAGLFEWFYLKGQFDAFGQEVTALLHKTEEARASETDAKAVQMKWETRKKKLHVWIPHNDIARIDDYLAEAVRLIAEREFPLACAKLEIVLHLTTCLPGTYSPEVENIL